MAGLRETGAATTGAGLVMLAALIPFATTNLIDVREFGVGVAIAVLLDIVILRPVLLPAAEAVLGRLAWWPTHGPGEDDLSRPSTRVHLLPRLHVPHRRPHPAHN
jgi:RND superfamily putative drug exporter